MVDSKNITSLPSVTRRRLLTSAISTAALPARMTGSDASPADNPILSRWAEWKSVNAEAAAWSKQASLLEGEILRKIGYPRVLISSLSEGRPLWATTHEDIDAMSENVPVSEEERRHLHSDLAALQARWDAASEATGLNAAGRNEMKAWARGQELANALFALPAQGIFDVIIKVTMILSTGEAEAIPDEHPWPHIRSVYKDLRRLAGSGDLPSYS